MKNPFELIREIELSNLDQKINNFYVNILNIEKFILWIVGFSVGGIALIISNIDKLRLNYNDFNLKIALLFFITSVFLGIFNRFSIHKFLIFSQITDIFLRNSLSNYNFPTLNPESISNETDFFEILDRFKLDFDLDYSRYIEEYKNYSQPDHRARAINELKDRHQEIAKFLQKTFTDGQENVRSIYKEAYNFSNKKSEKIYYTSQLKIAKKFNFWRCFVNLSFIFCGLTFILGTLILIVKF